MTPLTGNVLLTGASGGIGQAIARAAARRGAHVILSARRTGVLEPLAAEIGGRVLPCDLSQRDQVDRLAAEAGDVDVLIANAALPASGLLTELTSEQIDRMLEVNLRAPIALARALAPAMVSRGRGHMVFISSLAGKAASPASSIYSATKFGLRGFALGLRADLAPHGVGVSTVLPGFIRDAGMFEADSAEIEVAPMPLRVGATFASLAPGLAGRISRRMGSDQIATDLAAGQVNKR
jgi:short-subunit dehydrogenase